MSVNEMDIVKEIGLPAALEQCAEECMELGQVCLKYARKLRDDNPTPRTEEEILKDICEEMGDVMLCLVLLIEAGVASYEGVDSVGVMKEERWKERITEHKKAKKEKEKDVMGVYMKGE